jgi:hypothetical protein
MLEFLKRRPQQPAEQELTPEDYLAQADTALRVARQEYADACRLVSQFRIRHPEYVQVGNAIIRQFFPENSEWKAATRRESQAHHRMCQALEKRAELRNLYGPKESRYIAGVRV